MKIGVCFGGYCPMTRGHMEVIMRAKKECDKLVVFVCGYKNDQRANDIHMNLQLRTNIIDRFLNFVPSITETQHQYNSDIYVTDMDDDKIGLKEQDMLSLHNWEIWLDYAYKKICRKWKACKSKNDIVYYVGEESYYKVITENFGYNCVLINRNEIPISGTMVRNNPVKYWNYIMDPFKPYMCKKILVIGTASEGKSTLVEDIARYYNLNMIDERGRYIMWNQNKTDQDLTYDDFKSFVKDQNKYILNAIQKYNSTPFIISDTDNLVTLMYATAYAKRNDMPNISEDDIKHLTKYIEDTINNIKWDKIYVLTPNNKFVNDGTRFMGQSSIEERRKNFNILKSLIEKYYNYADIEYLTGGEYLNNFNIIKTYINEYYN